MPQYVNEGLTMEKTKGWGGVIELTHVRDDVGMAH